MTEKNEKSQAIEEFKGDRAALSAQGEATASRAVAEVQAAMVIAKRFPRDETAALARIKSACSRKALADKATYRYPRGGQTVTGPSIRLAEVLAQNWGNMDSGVVELEQRFGESSVMAYSWDLETNTRMVRTFTVKHERSAGGAVKKLSDPRDIYETVANQGARRLRACILAVVPKDIQDEAVRACEQTIIKAEKATPLAEKIARITSAFSKHGVTVEMIETRLRHKIALTTAEELADLRSIGNSIEDGIAKVADFFVVSQVASKLEDLTAKMTKASASPTPSEPAKAEAPAPSKEELASDEKLLAESDPVFALDGEEVLEPGSDLNEPPPFDDEPPKRAKARR